MRVVCFICLVCLLAVRFVSIRCIQVCWKRTWQRTFGLLPKTLNESIGELPCVEIPVTKARDSAPNWQCTVALLFSSTVLPVVLCIEPVKVSQCLVIISVTAMNVEVWCFTAVSTGIDAHTAEFSLMNLVLQTLFAYLSSVLVLVMGVGIFLPSD